MPQEINRTRAGGIPGVFSTPSIGIFLGLQILDVLTTLVGLHLGAQEGSAFIGHLLQTGPLNGLIVSKILAAAMAAVAVFLNKKRLLVFLNFWFAAVVVWNVFQIFLQWAG
jgi:uncharacterized protein DUF5658